MNSIINTVELFILRAIIRHRMRAYPYGSPHPETVKAIENGLCAVINLSNARPAKYADEPWIRQDCYIHASHCEQHAFNATLATFSGILKKYPGWTSDINQPEIAHACLRAMFCLHQYRKENGGA